MPLPQQPRVAFRVALHAISAYIMYWGFSALGSIPVSDWIRTQKGQHSQYLTMQGLWAAWLTMVVSLLVDVFPSQVGLKAIKRGLLIISMPLEVTISLIYWALIAFFPRLLFMGESHTSEPTSSSVNASLFRIPLGVDLALHAAPAIALILDFFLFEQRYSRYQTARPAPVAAIIFGLWYVCWIEYCASHNGMFPYPFLQHPFYIRALVYIGADILAIVSFRILNSLHP